MFYFIITLILLTLELVYFRLADKFDIIDQPNERSSHTHTTIRGGGVIFPFTILLYALWFSSSWWWVTGLLLISVISFMDDMLNLPNKVRIVVHLLAVSLLFNSLSLFLSWPLPLILLAYILVIGTINAWNFMDGINGITALYAFSCLLTLAYLNTRYHFASQQLIYVMGIATLIFGFFNFRKKAVCFAGDVGAVSISFVLIFLILSLILKTGNLLFVLLFAVYGVDSVMTICYRLSKKENIFEAHRSHLYQLMANEYKMSHKLVSCLYFTVQLLVNLVLISLLNLPLNLQWEICVGLLTVLAIVYWIVRLRLVRLIQGTAFAE